MERINKNKTQKKTTNQQQKKRKKKNPAVLLMINLLKKSEQVVLKDCSEKISVGPFEGEFSISGNYNLLNKKGKMDCELSLEKPFAMSQKLVLADSVLKLKHKTNILKVLQSFAIPAQGELNKYFDIQVDLELQIQLIDKDFTCIGSAKSSKYKFSIFQKEFGITQIGFDISGKKNQLQKKQVQLSLLVAQIPIKLVHSFGKYWLEAYVQIFPFGEIIQNFTDGFDDPFNIFQVLQKIQFKKNQLKFQNSSSLLIKGECELGVGVTNIKKGKFLTSITPSTDFKFNKIHSILQFLDHLNLDQITISLSNQSSKSRGLTIEGFLPIFKNEVLVKLCQVLYSQDEDKVKGIPFSLIVTNWKDITVKIAFLKNLYINESILLKQLDLIIKAAIPPAFGVQGQLDVTICGNQFKFIMSLMISTSITLTAELDGTWNEPFGLKNTYIKDLLLSIGLENFAVAGQIKIGEMTAKAAVSFDQVNPKKNMIFFDLKSFQLVKILSVFHVDLPQEIANILNIVKINEMKVEMVPPGGIQLGSHFYEEGFSALLDCEIFGVKAHLQLKYHNKSLSFKGSLSQIEIGNFLSITDFEQTGKGPSFDVLLALSAKAHFKMEGHLKIASILQTSVLASVDIQGLVFEAHMSVSFLQMFGLPFMQESFKLYAGFLSHTGKFKIQASYTTKDQDFDKIAEGVKEFLKKPLQKIKDAQDKLTQVQNKLTEAQNNFDIQQKKHINKVKDADKQYQRTLQQAKQKADATLENARATAKQKLEDEKKRADQSLELAKLKANMALKAESLNATATLQDQISRANDKLQNDRHNFQGHIEQAKRKVDQLIQTEKKLRAQQTWYNYLFYQAAIGIIKAARKIADGVLELAKEAISGGIQLVEKIYDGLIRAAQHMFNGLITFARGVCDATLDTAQKTYDGLLEAAQKTYDQMVKDAQKAFDFSIKAAQSAGHEAFNAYIKAVDLAFDAAKTALDVAKDAIQGAKTALKEIRQTLSALVDIAVQLAKDIRKAIVIHQIFFQLSVNSTDIINDSYALIRIDIQIVSIQIKTEFKIILKDILNLILYIVKQIVDFFAEVFKDIL